MWEEEVWIYDTPEVPNNFPFFKGKKYFFFLKGGEKILDKLWLMENRIISYTI